jgi:hypothetical protein
MNFILCCHRLDVDITELHSWITRSEAVLQSPEFAIYRKEGNFSDLKEKVNVGSALSPFSSFVLLSNSVVLKSLILLEVLGLKQNDTMFLIHKIF